MLEQKADPPAATSCETSLNTDEVVSKLLMSVIDESFCYKRKRETDTKREKERQIAEWKIKADSYSIYEMFSDTDFVVL